MSAEGARQGNAQDSNEPAWDEFYRVWSQLRHTPGEDYQRWMQAARKRVARNTPDDRRWLEAALADPERRSFVAAVFKLHPVPGRLLGAMVRAAVLTPNASAGRHFIVPCVQSLGARRVLELLLRYLETGTDAEKAGAVSALYYAGGNPRNEEVSDLWERLRCRMLREFVGNPDLDVRRRIIPSLELKPEAYPDEVRPLIPVAIQIARSHPDAYIRHRVEVQLGANVPLMPLPDTGAR